MHMGFREILVCLTAVLVIASGCAGDDANRPAEKGRPGEQQANGKSGASSAKGTDEPHRRAGEGDRAVRNAPEKPSRRQSRHPENGSDATPKSGQAEGPGSGVRDRPKKIAEGPGSDGTDHPKKDEGPGTVEP
jgi:hypothetical protein